MNLGIAGAGVVDGVADADGAGELLGDALAVGVGVGDAAREVPGAMASGAIRDDIASSATEVTRVALLIVIQLR